VPALFCLRIGAGRRRESSRTNVRSISCTMAARTRSFDSAGTDRSRRTVRRMRGSTDAKLPSASNLFGSSDSYAQRAGVAQ